jgi:transposase
MNQFPNLTAPESAPASRLKGAEVPIAQKGAIVTLKALIEAGTLNIPQSTAFIASIFGITPQGVNQIYRKAKERGFQSQGHLLYLNDSHVSSAPRSGAPKKVTSETTNAIAKLVSLDAYAREKSCEDIAEELLDVGVKLSPMSVWRMLRQARFKKVKPTKKAGLSEKMRQARLAFARKYENWTIEDWKRVIWTDETAVTLCRRGSFRIWRRPDEKFLKSCVRNRFKKYSCFMFWGAFSYDHKGPCHIYKTETTTQRAASLKTIAEMNIQREPYCRERWELKNAKKLAKPGSRLQWRWNKTNGKLDRSKKGGIDWWRYQNEVLKPKLLPFAKYCQIERKETLVMEDGAPSHFHQNSNGSLQFLAGAEVAMARKFS